jgi:hypothetical protein
VVEFDQVVFDAGGAGGFEDVGQLEAALAEFAEGGGGHVGFGDAPGRIGGDVFEVDGADAAFPLLENGGRIFAADGGPEDIELEADAGVEILTEAVEEALAARAGEFVSVVVIVELNASGGAAFGGLVVRGDGGGAFAGQEHAGADALDFVFLRELEHLIEGGPGGAGVGRGHFVAGGHGGRKGAPFLPRAGEDGALDEHVDGAKAGVGDHGGVLLEIRRAHFERGDAGGAEGLVGGGGGLGEGSAHREEVEAEGWRGAPGEQVDKAASSHPPYRTSGAGHNQRECCRFFF